MTQKPQTRCAIYTRKSSEEGLDQEFNSLDAQYEACSAYIASQRHEGWKLVPDRFDDGGISGGTMERPALQRLLAEIDAGRIGMVVVYKIDRLTRSLADFVRLVERLAARGCSFVSVTQAFNTSTSMGRLTLNVLLSFAQFEREVTAERIRDKIAASKKKGLWMGGSVPLGYDRHPDPQRRELVVNEAEAKTVQKIFRLYAELGSLHAVARRGEDLGFRPKQGLTASGVDHGASTFSRGQLRYLLLNPIYTGRIRHKDKVWPGLHTAIIDEDLWSDVQSKVAAAKLRGRGTPSPNHRILRGRLFDETGDVLTPTHSRHHHRRYEYYTSNRLITDGNDPTGWRLPAQALETAIQSALQSHLRQAADQHRILTDPDGSRAADHASRLSKLADSLGIDNRAAMTDLLVSAALGGRTITLRLAPAVIAGALMVEPDQLAPGLVTFIAPFDHRRRGIETRIVVGESRPAPDLTLIRVLSQAHVWARALKSGTPVEDLVRTTGHSATYLKSRIALAFLAPALQVAILDGSQRTDLSLTMLLRDGIPLDWDEQNLRFGPR